MPAGEHVLEDRENFNIGHRLFYIVCGTCRKFEKVVLRKPLPAGNMRSNFAWRKIGPQKPVFPVQEVPGVFLQKNTDKNCQAIIDNDELTMTMFSCAVFADHFDKDPVDQF